MEGDLRLLKEIFRPLFEAMESDQLMSIALVDSECRYIDLNGLNLTLEEMSRKEAIGKKMTFFEGYQTLTYMAMKEKRLLNEMRELPIGERKLHVNITSVPFIKEDKVIGAITFAQDVTERVTLEKKLIEADRMTLVGEMATRIMHDIRNPLQIISSSIQMIERWNQSIGDQRIQEKVGLIKSATNDVIDLMNNMLQFCKPETIRMEAVNVHNLIASIFALFSSAFLSNQITCNLQVDSNLIIFGDYKLLKQVLMNIVQNAMDVLRENHGERRLEIRGDQNRICIFNTGPIIPTHIQEQIFDIFFSTKGPQGTGLGLAICKEIVEKVHGGKIRCISNEELGGTVFEINFSEEAQIWIQQAAEVAVTREEI